MTTTRVTHYRTASPETWSLIRGAYLSGLSAPTVGARFGVSEGAIRKRAKREGWTKRDYAARATPWPGGLPPPGPGVPQGVAPAPPVEDPMRAAEDRAMERWRQPPNFEAMAVARKALAGAAHALKAGEGLNALRLARAAAEIARLDPIIDWHGDDIAESEAVIEARHDMMLTFLRDRALSLAEDIVAGRPLPSEFEALKAETARLAALHAEKEAQG